MRRLLARGMAAWGGMGETPANDMPVLIEAILKHIK